MPSSLFSNLRLFLPTSSSSSSSSLIKPTKTFLLLRLSRSILSSSETPYLRRKISTFRNPKTQQNHSPPSPPWKTMEEAKEPASLSFNRKRVEGSDARKPRNIQLKTRKLNPVNTIAYLQILGTGMDTQDTSPSVLLFFDKQRFIFNAGEGLQRFCNEHKIKLSKIDHIFLTRVCSETAGGIPGLLLTLAGIGEIGMTVNLWGPSDLKYFVDAMKMFIPNAAVIHTHSFGPSSRSSPGIFTDPIIIIDDEIVKISAILLQPFSQQKDTTSNSSNDSHNNLDCWESPGTATKDSNIAVVYICELAEINGKFDPAKAAALGLKPGPKYRELQLGNSVKSDFKNIMVHPSDVLGPSSPGPVVMLVDCPSTSHVEMLLSAPHLNDYSSNNLNSETTYKTVNCVIHLGPASIVKTEAYQKWMTRFDSAQHIMAGHDLKGFEVPILKSSARIASRLNYICPQLFPSSGFWTSDQFNGISAESSNIEDDSLMKLKPISAENLLKFRLRPHTNLGLDNTMIPTISKHSHIISELLAEIPEVVDVSKEVQNFWQGCSLVEEPWMKENYENGSPNSKVPSCLENISREDMEIVFLGTGSSQPSKYRNVSAIYVDLFSKGSFLLDCGEGTLGQLRRRFGVIGADDAVKKLKFIWVSHIHADHHTGIARLLALRCQLLRDTPHDPLLVIGPRQFKRYLDAYSRLEDINMKFIDCRQTLEAVRIDDHVNSSSNSEASDNLDSMSTSQKLQGTLFGANTKRPGFLQEMVPDVSGLQMLRNALKSSGLDSLTSVPVVHCPQAFGFVLRASERPMSVGKVVPGWKLVYSGDTRPCQALIDAAQGATILIHEATFEDNLLEEAVARNHSTTKEAVEVGVSAGVYRTILTHFSQRYPKIPNVDKTYMDSTCIAFDLMSVNIADLPVLPKVVPYLKLLFRNETSQEENSDAEEPMVMDSY